MTTFHLRIKHNNKSVNLCSILLWGTELIVTSLFSKAITLFWIKQYYAYRLRLINWQILIKIFKIKWNLVIKNDSSQNVP
jgi:hypothetical protein